MRCTHGDCMYQGRLGENIEYCNYIGLAGNSRRCDPAECDKYIPKSNQERGETNVSKDLSGFTG